MPATVSAQEIADRLSEIRQDGMSYVRLRMEIKTAQPSAKTALQLQIKARRTKSMSDLVIQVLWPKERKGEAVLLHQTNGSFPTGMLLLLPDTQRPLDASQMGKPLFGGDLSYEDFIDNFFAWHHQSIIGSEMLGGVSCVVLESKPGKGEKSSYASVKSWIDPVRMVPHRVEKYFEGGRLGCRIDTTRVVIDDKDRHIPGTLSVRRGDQGSVTEFELSNGRHGVPYTDADFTPEALKLLTLPHPAPP